jgi:GDPmannose 4,6-dehydratase
MKKALITGITGQDGSYLAELLLDKGYEVHGVIRRASSFNTARIDHLYRDPHVNGVRLFLHYGDLADSVQMVKLLYELQPDEVYNLGAQSHVRVSFDIPEYTGDVDGLGSATHPGGHPGGRAGQKGAVLPGLLLRDVRQGATGAPDGNGRRSGRVLPYGCAKVYAYWLTVNYRESYGLHASNGILFNHESPRRGETFVTRKITRAAAASRWACRTLYLGNLDAQRDWGYAKEYVEMMWLMLQQDQPDDYVVATNETHSVKEFCQETFGHLGLDWEKYVKYDQRYERPAEVELLIGDPAKARQKLGWEPKVKFKELVKIMVDHDLELAKREAQIARLPQP